MPDSIYKCGLFIPSHFVWIRNCMTALVMEPWSRGLEENVKVQCKSNYGPFLGFTQKKLTQLTEVLYASYPWDTYTTIGLQFKK